MKLSARDKVQARRRGRVATMHVRRIIQTSFLRAELPQPPHGGGTVT